MSSSSRVQWQPTFSMRLSLVVVITLLVATACVSGTDSPDADNTFAAQLAAYKAALRNRLKGTKYNIDEIPDHIIEKQLLKRQAGTGDAFSARNLMWRFLGYSSTDDASPSSGVDTSHQALSLRGAMLSFVKGFNKITNDFVSIWDTEGQNFMSNLFNRDQGTELRRKREDERHRGQPEVKGLKGQPVISTTFHGVRTPKKGTFERRREASKFNGVVRSRRMHTIDPSDIPYSLRNDKVFARSLGVAAQAAHGYTGVGSGRSIPDQILAQMGLGSSTWWDCPGGGKLALRVPQNKSNVFFQCDERVINATINDTMTTTAPPGVVTPAPTLPSGLPSAPVWVNVSWDAFPYLQEEARRACVPRMFHPDGSIAPFIENMATCVCPLGFASLEQLTLDKTFDDDVKELILRRRQEEDLYFPRQSCERLRVACETTLVQPQQRAIPGCSPPEDQRNLIANVSDREWFDALPQCILVRRYSTLDFEIRSSCRYGSYPPTSAFEPAGYYVVDPNTYGNALGETYYFADVNKTMTGGAYRDDLMEYIEKSESFSLSDKHPLAQLNYSFTLYNFRRLSKLEHRKGWPLRFFGRRRLSGNRTWRTRLNLSTVTDDYMAGGRIYFEAGIPRTTDHLEESSVLPFLVDFVDVELPLRDLKPDVVAITVGVIVPVVVITCASIGGYFYYKKVYLPKKAARVKEKLE